MQKKDTFKDGFSNWNGTLNFHNGDKYVGDFKDNKFHGQGTYTYHNGGKYIGDFKDGVKHGQGTETFLDGGKYVGDFKDDTFNGKGTYTFLDGDKYVGDFKDGNFNGKGTFTFHNGGKYVGDFKDGVKHGQGTETYHNGGKYVGDFKDGVKHGQGTETFHNGGKYVGDFKDGVKHGQGTETFLDGGKYVGDFKDGVKHGQERITYPNGSKYVGNFKDRDSLINEMTSLHLSDDYSSESNAIEYIRLGINFSQINEYNFTKECYLKAIQILEHLNSSYIIENKYNLMVAYSNYGIICRNKNCLELKEAILAFENSLATIEEIINDGDIISITQLKLDTVKEKINLGLVNAMAGNDDIAISIFKEIIEEHDEDNIISNKKFAKAEYYAYLFLGSIPKYKTQVSSDDLILNYYQAIKIIEILEPESINNIYVYDFAKMYFEMGEAVVSQGESSFDFKQSKSFLEKAIIYYEHALLKSCIQKTDDLIKANLLLNNSEQLNDLTPVVMLLRNIGTNSGIFNLPQSLSF